MPWSKLREYGYRIHNFPSHLDESLPGTWNKAEMLRMWTDRHKFKFVKISSQGDVQDQMDARGPIAPATIPALDLVAPVVATQPLTVEEAIKRIYDEAPSKFEPFYARLQGHPEASLVDEATVRKLVVKWRRGIRAARTNARI